MNEFKKMIEENKDIIIKKTQELITINSVLDEKSCSNEAPFGLKIKEALEYMLQMAKDDGFKTVNDDNYAGHIEYGNENGKLIGILCHLDVVPEGKGWKYPPYSGHIENGLMFGRGTIDDKGPTMAAYFALKFIKDANIKLKNKIRIILGTDEETGWRGVSHYFEKFERPEIGFAPDASFPLIYGEKGRMAYDLGYRQWDDDDVLISICGGERYNVVLDEVKAIVKKDLIKEFIEYANANGLVHQEIKTDNGYELILKGVAAHAMEPFKGINAGTHMCNFLKDYSNNKMVSYVAKYFHNDFFLKNYDLNYDDNEMGPITCNIGIMNICKNNTRVTLDLRYPVRYDVERFEKRLEAIAETYDVVVLSHSNKTPHYVSPEDELVQKLYAAYVKNTDDKVNKPFTIGGGTYASILPHAVAFGMGMPYEEDLCHQANEFVSLNSLFTSILIYIDAIIALGEIDA